MADHAETPGTAPVVDRRPVPRGVLPRGVQTWLMVALAVGMLLIIFLTGRAGRPSDAAPATAAVAAAHGRPRARLPGAAAAARRAGGTRGA